MPGVSTLPVIATAQRLPGTDPARLRAVSERVRPPGWWTKTARGLGLDTIEPRREFRRDLLAVAAAAVSVYGWLVGFGQLLLGTATPLRT